MKTLNVIVTVFLMVLIGSNEAFAVGSSVGSVSPLYVQGNKAFFTAGTHNEKPACSTVGDEWAIDISSESGKAVYAMLLTAYSLNSEVIVYGTGKCTVWIDREDVNYMLMP